jgi:glutathione S-transferase
MEDNFGEEHFKETGFKVQKGGYPDMGNGRYAQKLSYKEWFVFNNAQRAHYNFLEALDVVVLTNLVAGLYFPVAAIVLGVV